jgi:hypothetical protein
MRQKLFLIVAASLLIGAIAWSGFGQKSNTEKDHWQYQIIEYINTEETSKKLNNLGFQGWELVAVSNNVSNQGTSTTTQFVLKRRLF